jgi:hypothetical protein
MAITIVIEDGASREIQYNVYRGDKVVENDIYIKVSGGHDSLSLGALDSTCIGNSPRNLQNP